MQRRSFLTLCGGAATGSLLAIGWGLLPRWLARSVTVRSGNVFPGATIHAAVAKDAPDGSLLVTVIEHEGVAHPLQTTAAIAGTEHALTVPYPFADIVPGDYAVFVELRRGPRVVERLEAGEYTLRRVRFSA